LGGCCSCGQKNLRDGPDGTADDGRGVESNCLGGYSSQKLSEWVTCEFPGTQGEGGNWGGFASMGGTSGDSSPITNKKRITSR